MLQQRCGLEVGCPSRAADTCEWLLLRDLPWFFGTHFSGDLYVVTEKKFRNLDCLAFRPRLRFYGRESLA